MSIYEVAEDRLEQIGYLTDKLDRLENLIVDVLKPFADFIEEVDNDPKSYPWRDEQHILKGLKAGDFRAALNLYLELT